MNEHLLSHNLAIISEECSSVSYFLLNRRVTNESNLTITTTPIHPKLLSYYKPHSTWNSFALSLAIILLQVQENKTTCVQHLELIM